MKLNKERIFTVCIFLFAVAGFILTYKISKAFSLDSADPGPKLFPYICCIAILLCSVGKFITAKDDSKAKYMTPAEWKRAFLILGASALYAVLMYLFGYIPSTLIAAAGYVFLMRGRHKISPAVLAVYAVSITLILYYTFNNLLYIRMPSGILFR